MSKTLILHLQLRIEGDRLEDGEDNRKFILEVPGEDAEFDITSLRVTEEKE